MCNDYPSDLYYNIFKFITSDHAFLCLRQVSHAAMVASVSYAAMQHTSTIMPTFRLSVRDCNVDNGFLRKYQSIINWRSLDVLRLRTDTIREFTARLNLNTLISRTVLPVDVVLAHRRRINPNLLFAHQKLDLATVDALDVDGWIPWQFIHTFYNLNDDECVNILTKYAHVVNWNALPANNEIPERIIELFADNFNWRVLIKTQCISARMLILHVDKYDINIALTYQSVPMEIVDARVGGVDWCIYSRHQVINGEIRKKYQALICDRCLAHNRV